MNWFNVNFTSNRRWDRIMKRLAMRTPKERTKRSQEAKEKEKISWIKKRKGTKSK